MKTGFVLVGFDERDLKIVGPFASHWAAKANIGNAKSLFPKLEWNTQKLITPPPVPRSPSNTTTFYNQNKYQKPHICVVGQCGFEFFVFAPVFSESRANKIIQSVKETPTEKKIDWYSWFISPPESIEPENQLLTPSNFK